jgi:hypothetical protein
MIHDLTDLEPLLHRYDHEKVLVGPLLNLWTDSSFRVFNIAGKGGKIHETIGLGFFDVELDAQRRRAAIVAALEGCFGEVKSFDDQLEMAQMAHTLWANDETARFLATVSCEAKPRPTRETSQNRNLADPDKVTVLSDNQNNESGDEEACTAVAAPEDPGTLAESGSNLEAVKNLPPAVAGSFFSKKYPLWALSGAAAYLAACFVVGFLIGTIVFNSFTSMRQTANEATFSREAAASITAGNDPSQTTATVTQPIPASSIGTAKSEPQPRDAVRASSPPLLTSQPRVAEGQADAAPSPGAQPSQNPHDQAGAVADEQQSQAPKAQDNRADGSILPPQSSPPQTIQSSATETAPETAPVSIPQPPEMAPAQVLVSPTSPQITADRDGPELLPSEATAPKAPEALSAASQRQASNSAIVPLPRPRPAASAVSSDRPRRRVGPASEGARNPLLSLFGH